MRRLCVIHRDGKLLCCMVGLAYILAMTVRTSRITLNQHTEEGGSSYERNFDRCRESAWGV